MPSTRYREAHRYKRIGGRIIRVETAMSTFQVVVLGPRPKNLKRVIRATVRGFQVSEFT